MDYDVLHPHGVNDDEAAASLIAVMDQHPQRNRHHHHHEYQQQNHEEYDATGVEEENQGDNINTHYSSNLDPIPFRSETNPLEDEESPTTSNPLPFHEEEQQQEEEEEDLQPTMWDCLSGRGAAVNAHVGNKRFRALCFQNKPSFDAANHAAKKRLCAEIVEKIVKRDGTRFLKQTPHGWKRLSTEQAVLKAAQVMRDFRRPDRADRPTHKRNRATATPLNEVPEEGTVVSPIVELPSGVHAHDVLSGRGAFCNEHEGNKYWRSLALERSVQFQAGSYAEKRALGAEIVNTIHNLDPPGRFLQKDSQGEWQPLGDEKAIQKTCQVMRDMKRQDRQERDERRKLRKLPKEAGLVKYRRGAVQRAQDNSKSGPSTTDTQAATVRECYASLEQHDAGKNQPPQKDQLMM